MGFMADWLREMGDNEASRKRLASIVVSIGADSVSVSLSRLCGREDD